MKRVTFRVPEDHEIACSAEVEEMIVTASHGELVTRVAVTKNGDKYGEFDYGWYPTLDEAQTWAGAHARRELRRMCGIDKARSLV